jgi:hypothetical protein
MSSSDPPLRLRATTDFLNEQVAHPDEVRNFVAIAQRAGYRLTPGDANALWRQHSDELCAGWLVSEGLTDPQILEVLLAHGVAGPDIPAPGSHASWLDYAVDTLRPQDGTPQAALKTLEAARRAARAELEVLRRSRAMVTPAATAPAERTHAVMEARGLLQRIAQISADEPLPADILAMAEQLLRHYPTNAALDLSSLALPLVWGTPRVPLLDDNV